MLARPSLFVDLTALAHESMLERHLLPDYPPSVLEELNQIEVLSSFSNAVDLRSLLWCSIDNDDSKDLDQLTYAEVLPKGEYKIYIAVSDVAHAVKKNSAIDLYAQFNTTSVYTPTKVFSMLPEKLSTHFTSLNENEDRLALVNEIIVAKDGSLQSFKIYPSVVHNYAKLTYNSVSAWLNQEVLKLEKLNLISTLSQQLHLQDEIAHLLRAFRHKEGALTLETLEPQNIIENQKIIDIKTASKNRAKELIEDFMIAANTVSALFLKQHNLPFLRRIVSAPKRWDRICEIAERYKEILPFSPDAKALDLFLIKRRLLDPLHFSDLSLTIIKLLGNGEYSVEGLRQDSTGHFSLALKDYTHSTAPNRRYADLITQRMIKSVFENQPTPYTVEELQKLARQCTEKEDEAQKVERKMKKSSSILFLSDKIGETFEAWVTGAGVKGTWVRVLEMPIEGKLMKGEGKVDVGDLIKVQLIQVNIDKGFIDFVQV